TALSTTASTTSATASSITSSTSTNTSSTSTATSTTPTSTTVATASALPTAAASSGSPTSTAATSSSSTSSASSAASINAGLQAFRNVGCGGCHIMNQTPVSAALIDTTANSTVSSITITPFSDFAVHNMGTGLADGVSQGNANGTQFRSTPL